jgi:hypothetical protein
MRLMVTQNHLRKHTGLLQLSMDSGESDVLSIHRETPLGEVVHQLGDQHYVLVTDDGGKITGIVSATQICERMETVNRFERRRWRQMPVGALLNVTFTHQDEIPTVKATEKLTCVAIVGVRSD